MKSIFIWLFFIPLSFAQELNLQGWSIYSKNADFETGELIEKGVRPRQKVLDEFKRTSKRSFEFSICDKIIESTIGQVDFDPVEKSTFCERSIHLKDYMFYSIYRKKIEEKKLKEFREKMQNAFP